MSTALLEPLADAFGRHVLAGQAIFADDTPVKMWRPAPARPRRRGFGLMGATSGPGVAMPRPPSGIASRPIERASTPRNTCQNIAAGCMPMAAYRSRDIHEVACMPHVRRKFVDIHGPRARSAISDGAIRRIAQLYAVEKEARGSPPDRRIDIRQAKVAPIFDEVKNLAARSTTHDLRKVATGRGNPVCPDAHEAASALSRPRYSGAGQQHS